MPATIERVGTGRPKPEWMPYAPRGAARELMHCRSREVLIEGPADTGKSMACGNKVYLAAVNHDRNRIAVVRKTRKSLTQSTMVTLEQKVFPAGSYRFHESDQEYRFPNGSVVVVGGLDDPGKILSTEFDLVYVNEADQLEERDWEMLLTRCTGRWGVMPYTQIIGDCNPTDPGHWLYRREAAGKLTVLTATHADNPTMTPQRLAALEALTGYLRDRLFLGLRVAAEGMFFTDWDPRRHVVDAFDPPAHWTRWTATDYGFAAPFCTLFFARDPSPPRPIYVYRELYAAGLRDEQQAALLKARVDRERKDLEIPAGRNLFAAHAGDPSMFNARTEQNRPSIASVYRAHGIDLKPGTNNRRAGWQAVLRALAWKEIGPDGEVTEKPPRLRVMRDRAPNLVRTLPAMVRDPLDPEDVADAVNGQKTEDHAVDCLRYGLMVEAAPTRSSARTAMKVGG